MGTGCGFSAITFQAPIDCIETANKRTPKAVNMRPSRIKAKLARQQPVLVTTLHFTDPSVFELTSLMGFDGIWIDLEHHSHNLETANQMIRATRVGASDVIARPAKGEFMRMGRLLEAGAKGIMYPRCANAEEAAEVVRWAKFAPLGERGIDAANPDAPYCSMPVAEYVRAANEETFIVVQIEQPSALKHAEAIAAVPGIDILMLGPGDFSVLSGVPGQFDHASVQDAKRQIAAAAKKAGIHWGLPCGSTQQIREALELGARFICHGADILMVKRGLEQIRTDCTPLGFSFDDPTDNRVTL
jgi:4-hydroxy-2-oxoheptanedioate aldolase